MCPLSWATSIIGSRTININPAEALTAARHSAGGTALGLGLAVAAAATGGTIGSKIWPGKKKYSDVDATRHDHRV